MKSAQRRAKYLLRMSKQLLRGMSGDPSNERWIDQVGFAMQYKHGPLHFAVSLGILVSDSHGGSGEEVFITKGGVDSDDESSSDSESLDDVRISPSRSPKPDKVRYFLCKAGRQEKKVLQNLEVLVVLGDAIWSERPDVSTCQLWRDQTENKLAIFSMFRCPGYLVVFDKEGNAKYRPAWYHGDHLPRMIRMHPSPF